MNVCNEAAAGACGTAQIDSVRWWFYRDQQAQNTFRRHEAWRMRHAKPSALGLGQRIV